MNPGMGEIRFGNNATHKKPAVPWGQRRAFYLFPMNSEQSGDVIAAATTSAIRLIQGRGFEVRFAPINGNGQHGGQCVCRVRHGGSRLG